MSLFDVYEPILGADRGSGIGFQDDRKKNRVQ